MKIGSGPLFYNIWSVAAPKLIPRPTWGSCTQLHLIHHKALPIIVANLSTEEFFTYNLSLLIVLYMYFAL